jgi:hypothetical protein
VVEEHPEREAPAMVLAEREPQPRDAIPQVGGSGSAILTVHNPTAAPSAAARVTWCRLARPMVLSASSSSGRAAPGTGYYEADLLVEIGFESIPGDSALGSASTC